MISHVMRRLAVGTLIASSFLTAAAVSPANAETYRRYMTWNIYGNIGHQGDLTSAWFTWFFIDWRASQGSAPVAVALQEVCSNGTNGQAEWLSNQLAPYGYETHFLALTDGDNEVTCPYFGVAMIIYTNSPASRFEELLPRYGEEQRGVLCLVGMVGPWPHSGCVTHIDPSTQLYPDAPGGVEERRLQVQHANHISNNFNISNPVAGQFFGGDLNTPYGITFGLNPSPYTGRYEANSFTAGTPLYSHDMRMTPSRKIDYVFATSSQHNGATIERTDYWQNDVPNLQISDHAIIEGNFRVP